MHDLIAHPDAMPNTVENITVQVSRPGERTIWLEFHVAPVETLLVPAERIAARSDGLWRTTCFELFVQPEGSENYLEFNFSPSTEWAAYQFDRYRTGMRDLPFRDPEICLSMIDDHLFLSVEAMRGIPDGNLKLGLSAVIEEADGTKSYWALAHPPGKPDFHHPDCFTLELPSRNAA